MTNIVYNRAKYMIANQTLNLATASLKILLVNDTYTPNPDDDYLDEGGTHDIVDAEITSVTNYARKVVSGSAAWALDDTNDMAWFDTDDPGTWSNLGGAANDDIAGAILFYDTGVDTTAVPIAFYDETVGFPTFPFTTTGGDFSIVVNVLGWLNLT